MLVASQAVNLIILFLFTPYLVRALPQEEFGSYSQTLLIADFIGILVSLAVVQLAMMIFTRPDYAFEDALKTVMQFTLISSCLGVVFMWGSSLFAAKLFENNRLTLLLWVFSPYLLGLKSNAVLNQALIRVGDSRFIVFLSIFTNLIKLSLAFCAVHYFRSLPYMMLVYAIEPLISSVIQWWRLTTKGYGKGVFQNKLFRELFRMAIPLYLVEVLGASYTYISGFVISINLDENAYAVYKNGSFELPVIGTLYATISTVFMGDISSKIYARQFQEVAETKRRIIEATSLILFPVAIYFIVFAPEFVKFYYSEKYVDSIPVFMIFTAALLIRFQNYTDVLILLRRSNLVLFSFVLFVVSNFILNLVLSHYFGVMGCALATISSVYILALVQLVLTTRELRVSFGSYFDGKKMLAILLMSISIMLLVKWSSSYLTFKPWLILGITFSISVPMTIFLILKFKIVSIHFFAPVIERIPYFGNRLLRFLQ